MSNPIASFSGLASGVQWRDIVDQLLEVERSRTVAPLERQIEARSKQKEAWTTFRGLLEKLNDAARALRSGGIGGFLATAPASPTTSRTLFNATATSSATPGTYNVEVLQLAQAAKVSGNVVTNTKSALGFEGDFTIAGQSISVAADDTLESVRNKINAANTGATPTGVSATILSDGASGGRLVLTRTTPGATALEITDGATGVARELGFLDSRSRTISSTELAMAAALGVVTSPPPASIRVGDKLITVDLDTMSISQLITRINAAGGQASAIAEEVGDETHYRLVVQGNVQAVDGDADSAEIMSILGLGAGSYGSVQQSVSTQALGGSGGSVAAANTLLTDLTVGGASANLSVGDAINIRGTRGDGTAVTIGITIGASDTVQDLLDRINDATSGFGSGTRTATAIIGDDGAIRLTDNTGGDSRLSLQLGIVRDDGTTGSLGSPSVTTVGRSRELAAGQDAMIKIDGVAVTRSSNIISDAVPGASLSLLNAEPGTQVDLVISRNVDNGLTAVKAFADAFNQVQKFFDEQRLADQPLSANPTLRGIVSSLTTSLRTQVTDNSIYTRLSLMGLELDRTGLLLVDETKVKSALAEKPDEIEALFGFAGVGNAFVEATDNATRFGTGTISSQITSIDEGDFRLKARKSDAETRLELRRAALLEQYMRMERALSMLNSQGAFLSQQISALQART